MPHNHLINVGLYPLFQGGSFERLLRQVGIVQFVTILFAWSRLVLETFIREIEGRVMTQFGNQMERTLSHHL
jgi:hypothetical protein